MQTDKQGKLAHMVYFSLLDDGPEAVQRIIDSAHALLSDIEGVEFLGIGKLIPDLDRPVNVRDFQVGIHVIFRDRAAHDAYQIHPQHQQFIADNKSNWKLARVFDCTLL
ncbi:MAG: Dabb family protein [Planctomycetota bacterium]|nr:Dabb family protein [Planctomycetota bacterium]MDA1214520.1 Dabb family protein [Planctomycetota bacterium]